MKKKLIVLLTLIIISISFCGYLFSRDGNVYTVRAYEGTSLDLTDVYMSGYQEYLEEDQQVFPDEEIIINASDYTEAVNDFNEEVERLETFNEIDGLFIPETMDISWEVNVEIAGYYNIKIKYAAYEGRSSDISKGIMIDDVYPFSEAENFVLSRIWQDDFDVSSKRVEGEHDLKPEQIEKTRWNTEDISDSKGYYEGKSYYFYFTEGNHKITLVQDKEPVIISEIVLYQSKVEKSYNETLDDYTSSGYQQIEKNLFDNGEYTIVQGENAFEKSSPILAPVANWSSYKVDPYEKFMMRYNTIGGTTWRVAGDWISWNIEVPESGLYRLTFKINQSYKQGSVSSRILKINGEVPFVEARTIEFKYDNDWQNVTLGNGEEDYWFYLEAGDNIVSLEATIGNYNNIIRNTEATIQILNSMYRQIVMITGTNPDEYQDYMLNQRIENLQEMINQSIANIERAMSDIISIAGNRSSLISTFEKVLYQLEEFKKSEKNIQIGLNKLDDNISALGTWVMMISEQPLSVDSIYAHSQESEIPKATTNFFQKFWHELIMLFGSYGANTSLESNVVVDGPTITVWIMTGRDQSQLLRQIIDEQFTIQNNVNIELKLVTSTALLPATLSNNGPDVALGVVQNIPVNWGIRNAVVDLTQFPDYEEVSQRFSSSAITPFEFMDKVYALPDTHDFLVTFVRDDIVEELDIEVPKTWDDVVGLLPGLQRQYLDYYILNSKGILSSVMYSMIVQNGGELYDEEGRRALLLEENAMDAFIDFTTFFSDFGFEISANFANRFRSGEMPLGIVNFSLYNTLSVFAPEIRGQWSFAPIPGYLEGEEIHNESASTSTGTIILEDTQEKAASWEFVKWWLSAEAQTSYARGMEAILGAAARHPTANLEAFANLPWSVKDYYVLSTQRENTVGVPTVPGDYIIGRYIDNAFRATINDGTNPRDNLFEYVTKINIELERKRSEFNLD